MITYPRKCPICEYVANNPAMYSYHKQTHQSIPADTLCHFGCGSTATHRNTGGKYTCKLKYQECPSYIDQLSNRTKKSWEGAIKRKEETKKCFYDHCSGNETARKKAKQAIKEKWGDFTPEQMKDFRQYARRIRVRAQKWAKAQGYVLGQQTFHVDHKFSIWDSWVAGLPESVVNHPTNLRILEANENSSKGAKSLYTLEELLILTS
jgi:hypothetical protein